MALPGEIIAVAPHSIAEEIGLKPGDRLIQIDDQPVRDMVDYRFLSAAEDLRLTVERNGRKKRLSVQKEYEDDLGLEFSAPVFDGTYACKNKCVFCFLHQNPRGMRRTLYFPDDDYRLSFLHGHYVTLTNLEKGEFQRILDQRLSPLYVSVHSTEQDLRRRLLGKPEAEDILLQLTELVAGKIEVHTQVVLVPGLNDGAHLDRTIDDLSALYPGVRSVAVVPVGLTRYREGLPGIRMFEKEELAGVIRHVHRRQREMLARIGTRFAFLGDEFYLNAGIPVPGRRRYEDFPQMEDGIGMTRVFLERTRRLAKRLPTQIAIPRRVAAITGTLAAPVLQPLVDELNRIRGLNVTIVPVTNRFYGESIKVAGLITGGDVYETLSTLNPQPDLALLPRVAVRDGDEQRTMLDDITVDQLSEACALPIQVVPNTADGLVEGCLGLERPV
ncbi:MAG TPA: DUF512 domain-containing protein [Armatimonadota bacterium]|nr:DUF512 domain-containing protein [Armatimonadota bacterium]